ncbi:MAG: hypothetical protein LBE21_09955, partial [Pseudomonadales bacterium]|nr:hypothetical protein [Pseudomonadales bacterium]
MNSRDVDVMAARGFPPTPPEKSGNFDSQVVQLAPDQTVTAHAGRNEVFVIHAHRADVANFSLSGSDLVIEFCDCTKITIRDFFSGDAGDQLVFIDGSQAYWVDFSQALNGVGDGIADELVQWFVPEEHTDAAAILLGLLGAAAGIKMVDELTGDDDGGNVKPATPDAPTSYEDNVGSIQNPASAEPVTDDPTPGINIGKGVTDTPTLYVDDEEVPSTYDPDTGTLTPDESLEEGEHEITYTLT